MGSAYVSVPSSEGSTARLRWPSAGRTSVWVPEQSGWNYRCRVVDPQGVEWTLGAYRRSSPPTGDHGGGGDGRSPRGAGLRREGRAAQRRRDAETLLELFSRVTGEEAALRGSIVGFGSYHYKYDSGREGDTAAVSFAPRKAASTIYLLDGVGAHAAELERLGPHTTGVGCLYVKDVSAVNLDVLAKIVAGSYRALTAGVYTKRARGGGKD